jgi:formylglycine-generating enzyme required for sulfatase activity
MTKKHIAILAGVTSSFVLGVAAIFLASPSPAGSLAVSDTASGSTDVPLPVQAQVALDEDAFVTIPGGTYTVGCDEAGKGCREVTVETFDVSKYEVTFAEWDACVDAGGCSYRPDDNGWGRDQRPVINLSWEDVGAFLEWKSTDKKNFRIPSMDEYLAAINLDNEPLDLKRDCRRDVFGGKACNQNGSSRVGYGIPNRFGIFNLYGNVSEFSSVSLKSNEIINKGECLEVAISGMNWRSNRDDFIEQFVCVESKLRLQDTGFRLVRGQNADAS